MGAGDVPAARFPQRHFRIRINGAGMSGWARRDAGTQRHIARQLALAKAWGWRSSRVTQPPVDDDLDSARGIVTAVIVSLAFWTFVLLIWLAAA